jgi:hypothetical protein
VCVCVGNGGAHAASSARRYESSHRSVSYYIHTDSISVTDKQHPKPVCALKM